MARKTLGDITLWKHHDASGFYRDYKDVNDYLVAEITRQAKENRTSNL